MQCGDGGRGPERIDGGVVGPHSPTLAATVTGSVLAVALALAATCFFALSTALKHRSAALTPDARGGAPVGEFLRATTRHPLWLAGIATDVGGLALQVTALHVGALSVVQPVMITALVLALVAGHRVARTRMTARELVAASVLVAALAGFLWLSGASSPGAGGPAAVADRQPAVWIGAGTVLLALVCVTTARRLQRGAAAALLGVTVGVIYACTAALIKACSNVAVAHGPLALLTSWQPYVLLVAGAAGLLGAQLAFQAGPLRASLPATATLDPLMSIVLGVLVYDEQLRSGIWAVTAEIACLAVLSATAVYLSRLQVEHGPAGAPATT